MNNDTILHINSLSKSFSHNIKKLNGDNAKEEYCVLDRISLQIAKGKITAIIGSNGAGKTTLFNIISGFLPVDFGTVNYNPNGKEYLLNNMQAHKLAGIGIGRMFQDNHIFHKLSVLDNMLISDTGNFGENAFSSLFYPKTKKIIENQRIEQAKEVFITLFGTDNPLWEKRYETAETLSYGQQRLLGLARLFMSDYKLVLLDEPTAGVNPLLVKEIATVIRKMVDDKRMSVLLIEHNMSFVESIADECVFMNDGKIEISGSVEKVLNNSRVRENYLGKRTAKLDNKHA